jgi:hypothetical protein
MQTRDYAHLVTLVRSIMPLTEALLIRQRRRWLRQKQGAKNLQSARVER